MGTRCHIGVRKGNKVDFIYCGHDGYVDGIGELLIDRFNSIENARKLIDLGNVSWVYDCSENETEEYMEPYLNGWELVEVIPGVFACVKKGTKSYSIPAPKYVEFGKNQTIEDSIMIEYWYLFEDGEWMVSKGGDVANYISVKEALKKPELVESHSRRGRMLKEDRDTIYYVNVSLFDENGKWVEDLDVCDGADFYDSDEAIDCAENTCKEYDEKGINASAYVYEMSEEDPDGVLIHTASNFEKTESRRPRGRMLKEYKDEMPIPYLIGQVKFEDGWSPMVVYLNWGDDRYWYEASVIEAGGVMDVELGRQFVVSKVKPGADKCDPEEVYAVKRHFFDGCEDQDLPVREVKTVRELGLCAPVGRELHSQD